MPLSERSGRRVGSALAGVLLLAVCGCETTELTTLEANSAAYAEARSFLRVSFTHRDEVSAKYGKPKQITASETGESWIYWQDETLLLNAYTHTPGGTRGAIIRGERGFQHTVLCRTWMQLTFDRNGILADYEIRRRTM